MDINSCRRENNICLVGGSQEHGDLTSTNSWKKWIQRLRSCNKQPHPLPFQDKRSLNCNLGKTVLWNTSPPSSWSSGFPKSVDPLPQQLLSQFSGLLCGEQHKFGICKMRIEWTSRVPSKWNVCVLLASLLNTYYLANTRLCTLYGFSHLVRKTTLQGIYCHYGPLRGTLRYTKVKKI